MSPSENLRASTARFRAHNDSIEAPSAKLVRERRERLANARDLLRRAGNHLHPSKRCEQLAVVLRIVLDELEDQS